MDPTAKNCGIDSNLSPSCLRNTGRTRIFTALGASYVFFGGRRQVQLVGGIVKEWPRADGWVGVCVSSSQISEVKPMRVETISAVVIIFVAAPFYARCQELKSGEALLWGIESARTKFDTVRASFVLEFGSGQINQKFDCTVEQSGNKRRFEQLPSDSAKGAVVLVIGDDVKSFRRDPNEDLCIYDVGYAVGKRGDLAFDPRILGLDDLMAASTTVKQCLGRERSKSIELLGRENIRGINTYHVKTINDFVTSDFWIAEPSFRLYRLTTKWPGGHVTVESDYDSKDMISPFPKQVAAVRTEGNATKNVKVTVTSFESGINILAERFEIKSMNLPLNTGVVDYRTQRRIGYWDGDGIAQEPVDPTSNPTEFPSNSTKRGRIIVLAVAALGAAICLILFLRRRKT